MPTRNFSHILSLYDAQQGSTSDDANAADPARLMRLQTNATLLRLKNCTFYGQWQGTQEKADYLFNTLAADVEALRPSLFREIGF